MTEQPDTGANDNRPDSQREWWTPVEVANLYRVHKETVYRWIHVGKLPAIRISRNLFRIRREDVMAIAGMKEGLDESGHPRAE